MKPTTVKSSPTLLELSALIGQGANGCVYSGWRTDAAQMIRQRVAIKILNSKNLVDVWKDEFSSLMRIDSPRCVRVFGFEWIEDRPALILELVEGIDLAILASAQGLEQDEIRYLICEIYRGLSELNAQGLCHGDLSPSNVLIDLNGRVRLVDFGFGNSKVGRRQVTPVYAAPEVLSGEIPTFSSDLWSLGALAEFLVVQNEKPFAEVTRAVRQLKSQRKFDCGDYDASAAKSLGVKVKRFMQWRSRQMQTRNLDAPSIKRHAGGVIAAGVLGVVFALTSRGSASAVEKLALLKTATVQVRSNFGRRIHFDGRDLGFAPVDIMGIEPGHHELIWQGSRDSGRLTLTLNRGQNIVIGDDKFKR